MKNEFCKTKYPIVLAHGLAARETGGGKPYWGRIPAALQNSGAAVYLGGQDAWGSIETGAAQLARAVLRACEEQGSARVNLVAHSKGGLEARYLISSLGMADRVASLTMLSTPNRGSDVAQALLRMQPGIGLWARGNDAYWRTHGDEAPNTLRAGEQLSPPYFAQFNAQNPDAPGVYYQSWGARLNGQHPDGAMLLAYGAFYPLHGESDGLVTPGSARWGRYRGTLEGVSHQQLCDAFARDTHSFSPRAFHLRLAQELRDMGF